MIQLNSRNRLADLLNDLGLTGDAAFVGVAEGQFEFYFIERWKGSGTLIDAWRILNAPGFSGHGEDTDAGQEARYQRIIRGAQKFGSRCKVMRATSEEAAPRFADGSLDFCYVDADHSTDGISLDATLWWPKVRRGGIFAGHDFLAGNFNGQEYGVKTVIDRLAKGCGVPVNVTGEKDWPSFWIVKP